MLMIVQDRYNGIYSGGKFIIITDYRKPLTTSERDLFNKHIEPLDCYYNEQYPDRLRDKTLKEGDNRLKAVEQTLLSSDLYAAMGRWLEITWIQTVDTLFVGRELEEIIARV